MIREENEISNVRVFDTSIELKDNAMLKHRMELYNQWDFEKNDELGLDVYKATFGSDKIAWWNCPKCKSPYDMTIINRTQNKNCPYCVGLRINHTNSLASLHPELSSQWHPILNGELSPQDVACGHNEKAWWLGDCGHWWDATINSRTKTQCGCPYCAGQKTLVGFNDMWTINPLQASLLANPDDGYKYMQSSGVKVDWKCPDCGNIIRNKSIGKIYSRGLSCSRCSDGIQFPEKFMYNFLKKAGIDFVCELTPKWSQGKRYDFYLPDYNWIIETHGEQHYKTGFRGIGGQARTLKEEQENDEQKEQLAKVNGIDNYIVIDSRYSTVEWMKNSISDSDLMEITTTEIDFERIGQLASSSFVKISCDLWNSGMRSTSEIAKEMNLSLSTIRVYLKRGKEIGWCKYNASRKKPIVQLSVGLDFIHEWESNGDAGEQLKISIGNISSACKGKRKTTGGFKWMYKEDYDKLIVSSSPVN